MSKKKRERKLAPRTKRGKIRKISKKTLALRIYDTEGLYLKNKLIYDTCYR
jgi:hypothetical protein